MTTVDYLSALNVGSGLNTTEIIDALVEAERAPVAGEITEAKDKKTVEISSLGQVKQGFEGLSTNLAPVEDITGLYLSSSGSAASLEFNDPTLATSFSHSMTVSSVAAGQTLVFDGYASETASTGTGSLTFSFGTWSNLGVFSANSSRSDSTVSLASGSGTLADLRTAINDADMDVTASILKTSDTTYALVLKAREGAAHAMRITATEDAGAAGLSNFSYTSADASVQTVAASDVSLELDGVEITRDTNEITDLIKGVTVKINATTSSAETISGEYSATTAQAALQVIVDQLNTIGTTLRDISKRGSAGSEDAPLAGDPYVSYLRRQLRNYTTTPISGFGDDAIYLADFGVTTNRDGTISLNTTKFQSTFAANPDAFTALTTSRITSSSELVTPTVAGTHPKEGIYTFDLAADNTATLNGSAMTVSGSDYTISNHDAGGLKLTITGGGADASIYVGKSLFDSLDEFTTEVLSSNGDLAKKIENYNDDVESLDEDLSQLDVRIEALRSYHVAQFAAMNAAVASFKETEKTLDNMMESWKAGLQK